MDTSIYKKLLVDENSDLSAEIQVEIINSIFDVFVECQNNTLFINNGYIKQLKSKQAFLTLSKMFIKNELDIDIMPFNAKAKKKKWAIKINEIYDTLTTINSYAILKYEIDLFADKQTVIKDDVTNTIKVIANKLHIKPPFNINIDDEYNKVVNDYKNHFPYFDELLDLIINMRFAKDRKASFLHFRVKSDWGKSFLAGLLKNIEIAIEIDYHNLMNKGANDIAPIQVRNSFVMIIDEFNNFSQEMKKLSHSFTFAPKFGMSETVDLYLKILFSAEKSPSFSGGVDDQIVNRVMVFDIKDDEAVELVKREIYKEVGNAKYMQILEHYAISKINQKFNEYINMDKFEAHKKADIAIRKTYNNYKMEAQNLNKNVSELLNDTIYNIANSSYDELDINLSKIKNNIIKVDNNYFVKSPLKTFEAILKAETSENEYKKMRFKLSNIESLIKIKKDFRTKAKRINNKVYKGLLLEINEPKTDIEVVYETINEAEEVF